MLAAASQRQPASGDGWLQSLDVDYVSSTNDIIELHRIVAAARNEGRGDLSSAAEARLQSFSRPRASEPPA
eukprot:COSAG06_NODE_4200_length_4484_cov_3.354846_1_plen_70_part_10